MILLLVGTASVEVGQCSAKYDDVTFCHKELSFVKLELLKYNICKHPHSRWQICVSLQSHLFLHKLP